MIKKKKKNTLICTCLIPLPDSSNCETHSISTMKSKAFAKKPEMPGKKSFLKAMREVGEMYFFLLTSSPFGYFSAGPIVRASPSKAEDVGLIPG